MWGCHTCPEPWSRFKKRHKQKVNVLLTPLPYWYWELLSKPQKIGKKLFFGPFFTWKMYFFSFKASILSCFTLVFSQLCSWWYSDLIWPPKLLCRSKIDVLKILGNIKKVVLKKWLFLNYMWVSGIKIVQNFTRNAPVIIPKWNKTKWML